MAKRSIENYKPVGLANALEPGHRFGPKALVAELIEAAAPLPVRTYETTLVTPLSGNLVERPLSARAKFILSVEKAAAAYHLASEDRTKPSALQLSKEFRAIEQAAFKLLRTLQAGEHGDLDKVPYAIRYDGLQAWAALELEHAAKAHTEPFMPREPVAETRVRAALKGVAAIKRWASSAHKRKLETFEREQKMRSNANAAAARHDGNAPLNEYLYRVFTDCWWGIAQREITDAPKPIAFCKLAARVVGVKLRDDGARDRLRRMLGRRGKSEAV